MNTCITRWISCVAAALLIGSLQAQPARRGAINGVIRSTSGAPLPNVSIEIENLSNGAKRQTNSDASGNYRFDDLEPGRYRISSAMAANTATPTQEIEVSAGTATVVNLSAGPQVWTVSMSNPVTNVQQATPIQELTGPRIENSYNTRNIQYLPSPSYLARNGAAFGAYNLSLLSAGVASNGGIPPGRSPVVGGQRPIQ